MNRDLWHCNSMPPLEGEGTTLMADVVDNKQSHISGQAEGAGGLSRRYTKGALIFEGAIAG